MQLELEQPLEQTVQLRLLEVLVRLATRRLEDLVVAVAERQLLLQRTVALEVLVVPTAAVVAVVASV